MPTGRIIRTLKAAYSKTREAVALATSENYRFLQFAPPGHFYSPLPDLPAIRKQAKALFSVSEKTVAGIDLNEKRQLREFAKFVAFATEFAFPETATPAFRYYLRNNYFTYGDAVALYSLLRAYRPKRIVEVGSGFSSALMLDTLERFRIGSALTLIDPYPDRLKKLLKNGDAGSIRLMEKPVQDVPLEVFRALGAGDLLFIDSSHVSKALSDVNYLLFEVLPLLKKGVLIHFHDILWPFEYPREWFEQGTAWNEAYLLRAFLQHNRAYEIVFFNSYMAVHQRKLLRKRLPVMLKTYEEEDFTPSNSSLWLVKK